MTVYFISSFRAGLTLNGIYVGIIDSFERRIEMDLGDRVLVQVIPDGNGQTFNFFMCEEWLDNPPPCLDVYRGESEVILHFKYCEGKDSTFNIVAQTVYSGATVTIFKQGKIYLAIDGEKYDLYPLPIGYSFTKFSTVNIGGYDLLAVEGKGHLALIDQGGKMLFCEGVDNFFIDDRLHTTKKFATCRQLEQKREYTYDGYALTPTTSYVAENLPVPAHALQFAFFESVLYGASFERYLCDGLKEKAHLLKDFLGEFCDVIVPTETFFRRNGEKRAVGLVYKQKDNLFKIAYYGVEIKDALITNVFPIE